MLEQKKTSVQVNIMHAHTHTHPHPHLKRCLDDIFCDMHVHTHTNIHTSTQRSTHLVCAHNSNFRQAIKQPKLRWHFQSKYPIISHTPTEEIWAARAMTHTQITKFNKRTALELKIINPFHLNFFKRPREHDRWRSDGLRRWAKPWCCDTRDSRKRC